MNTSLSCVGLVLRQNSPQTDCASLWPDENLASNSMHWRTADCRGKRTVTRIEMLHYAVVFFIIAIIAAVFGFTGIAVGAVYTCDGPDDGTSRKALQSRTKPAAIRMPRA